MPSAIHSSRRRPPQSEHDGSPDRHLVAVELGNARAAQPPRDTAANSRSVGSSVLDFGTRRLSRRRERGDFSPTSGRDFLLQHVGRWARSVPKAFGPPVCPPPPDGMPSALRGAPKSRSRESLFMDARAETCSPVEVLLLRPKPRVLLAEDDVELRALYGLSLRNAGYDVVDAADGTEALEQLVASPAAEPDPARWFDAAVLDIRMPGFSGLHVLAALRHVSPAVPIILMTAFSDERVRMAAHRLGAAAMLSKPFRLQALTWAVANAVGA